MEENEKWLRTLREKLDKPVEPLPVDGWNRLEKELHVAPRSNTRLLYRWSAVAAVALLVLLPAGWWFLQTPTADDIRQTPTPVLAVIKDDQQPSFGSDNQIIQPVTPTDVVAAADISSNRDGKSNNATIPRDRTSVPVQMENGDETAEQTKEPETIGNSTEPEGNTSDRYEQSTVELNKEKQPETRRPSDRSKYHLPVNNAVANNKKWSFGVRMGNSGMVSEGSEMVEVRSEFIDRISLGAISTDGIAVSNNQTIVFDNAGAPYLQSSEVADAKHRQPVTVGLTARKDLGRGFSVESGVTYTFLSSEITYNDTKKFDQKLHYMGIPLRGNWDFLERNNFTLYLSAGGTVEKCVYGKLDSEKQIEGPLQLSVMSAVGVQYNVGKRVALYFEPGVSYYFDNGSDVTTIRKDNPFNLNLQAGIRLLY